MICNPKPSITAKLFPWIFGAEGFQDKGTISGINEYSIQPVVSFFLPQTRSNRDRVFLEKPYHAPKVTVALALVVTLVWWKRWYQKKK